MNELLYEADSLIIYKTLNNLLNHIPYVFNAQKNNTMIFNDSLERKRFY